MATPVFNVFISVDASNYTEKSQKSMQGKWKAPYKKVAAVGDDFFCRTCGVRVTPLWRTGPNGRLCNTCGLRYAKQLKKETLETVEHDKERIRYLMSIERIMQNTQPAASGL